MPQPKTPDAPAAPPAPPTLMERVNGKPAEERTAAERQIVRAGDLERERASLMEKIGKNRDYLRLMDANEELTEEEGQWLETFYPTKEREIRRSKEDIEATRQARKEARKGGAAA